MNHWISYLFGTCLLTTTVSGCLSQPADPQSNSTVKLIPVKTVSVVQEEIQKSTTQPATVHAYYTVEIRPKVTGYVTEVHFDIGDVVKKNDVLATVDVPEMQKQKEVILARITRFQAAEKQSEAGIKLANAEVISAEAKLSQAKSELNRSAASLAAAEAEFVRTKDLVDRQSIERRLLDEARKKRDSELASKQSVASAIISAEANIIVAQAKLSAAQADLATAQADTTITQGQVEEIDVLMEYATLKAPFDGVVTHRTVDPGTLVRNSDQGGSQPLMVISKIDRVRVRIPVPETEAVVVNRGDPVTLRFPFYPNEEPIEGVVARLSNSLDPSTRTMLVEAEFENADGKMIPGMFGQASIAVSSKVVAKMLPARAIRFSEEGKAYVYAIDENETVTVVDITTGFDNGNFIEVVSGLQSNQRVIDTHLKRFTDGQKVSLLPN